MGIPVPCRNLKFLRKHHFSVKRILYGDLNTVNNDDSIARYRAALSARCRLTGLIFEGLLSSSSYYAIPLSSAGDKNSICTLLAAARKIFVH